MAEFIRIWDDTIVNTDGSLGDYIEYDTTVVESETVYVPVSNISISRPLNTGTVIKVIDTNDVIKRFQSLEVAQIQKFITVEKSDVNRFSIERSNANSVNVESSRSNIIVNTSGIGQKGEKGDSGKDSVLAFLPSNSYKLGRLVSFDGKVWSVLVDLDGSITPLENPTEGSEWTELANHKYIQDLPLTSGYEIESQDDWDAIERIIEFGDLVRTVEDVTLKLTTETKPTDLVDVGAFLEGANKRSYRIDSTHSFSTPGNSPIFYSRVKADDGGEISEQEFENVLSDAGIVFGHSFSNFYKNTVIYNGLGQPFVIRAVTGLTVDRITITVNGPGGGNPNLPVFDAGDIRGRLFGDSLPGLRIDSTVTDLVVGDIIHAVGKSENPQEILRVIHRDGDTFYDIQDYAGFEDDDDIIGTTISYQSLLGEQWYIRNNKVAVIDEKLKALTSDDSSRITVLEETSLTEIQKTSVEGLITDDSPSRQRDKIVYNRLFSGTGLATDDEFFTQTKLTELGAVEYLGIEDGAQVNFVKDVDESGALDLNNNGILSTTGEENFIKSLDQSGGLVRTGTELSLDSTQEGGSASSGKVLRLRSDGHLSSSVFGQINLSETETFETIVQRNAFTGRIWTAGSVAIITGDPAATDPFTGSFIYEGVDQTVAGVTEDSDWVELATPTGTVSSVAGKTGVVNLAIEDIGTNEGSLETALGTKVDKVDGSRLGEVITEFNQIVTNTTAIGEADRDPTQQEIDDGDASLGQTILGSGLEQAVAYNTTAIGDSDSGLVQGVAANVTSIGTKQDKLLAGTNISIANDGKTISVQNTSGVQVTVFAFGIGVSDSSYNLTPDGDSITVIQFTGDDPAIDIPDLLDKGWEIFDTSLDTDIWQVSGSCSETDSDGNIINNRKSCEIVGTWTVDNNAKLQRIT